MASVRQNSRRVESRRGLNISGEWHGTVSLSAETPILHLVHRIRCDCAGTTISVRND